MKKIITPIIAALLLLSIVSCDTTPVTTDTEQTNTEITTGKETEEVTETDIITETETETEAVTEEPIIDEDPVFYEKAERDPVDPASADLSGTSPPASSPPTFTWAARSASWSRSPRTRTAGTATP